jgi:crotonobetainyl-CoA:carnitine CoA-transferase CaiB-like acyl-CoA transferase
LLGARRVDARSPAGGLELRSPTEPPLTCTIEGIVTHPEQVVQALTGLMTLHGSPRAPRRLGLDVASAAAALLASQGMLAALVGRRRGQEIRSVETSVLDGALVFVSHRLPTATCGADLGLDAEPGGPGPPFPTADGAWVELEALRFDTWLAFWRRLGVSADGLDTAWSAFALRYLTGRCALPPALHSATYRRTVAELRVAADACGVAVVRLRGYDEVLAERSRIPRPWTFRSGGRRPPVRGSGGGFDEGPLAGLRVVELATRLQGPLASLLLRRLGAEVVKVEPPGGDVGRAGTSAFGRAAYLAYNRGKEVVEIDVKKPAGRAQLIDLASTADVFLHNSRPGRAERQGFAFDDVARARPGVVYCHASGWDEDVHAPAEIAGDYLVQAHAGCGEGLSPAGAPAFPSPLTLVDATGGLLACEGILAGLFLREETGCGWQVGTSLYAAAMILQRPALDARAAGRERGQSECPLWGPLETAEGFLVVAADDEGSRRRLAAVTGAGSQAREAQIAGRLRRCVAAEWQRELRKVGIAAAVVREDLRTLPDDPLVAPRLEQLDGGGWAPSAPWHFNRAGRAERSG